MRIALMAVLTLLQVPPALSPESIVDDVGKLTAARDNDARFDALREMLRARNLTATVEPFTIEKPLDREPRTRGRNVVVSIGEGVEYVLVGAHYDAERLPDGSLSQGAVDNGASAVMLVRLAESLRNGAPPVRVRIVWFDMEEVGLVGSRRYLEAHAGDRIGAMLNFDINGYGDTVLFGAPAGGEDARLRKVSVETCASEGIDCLRFAMMPPGDDRTFGRAKIPTLSIATLPAVEAHQLWLTLHAGAASGLAPGTVPAVMRTIHTPDDVLAKIDGGSVARIHRFALALVRHLGASRQ
jgi:hypothetical protein